MRSRVFKAFFLCFLISCVAAAQHTPRNAGAKTPERAAAKVPNGIALKAPDGIPLKVTYFAAEKPGPGVILLHQCNSDRSSWNNLAAKLVAAGFHVLTMDLRGYGGSGGPRHLQLPGPERLAAQQKWPADIDVAYEYLTAQPGVDAKRIGAAGASCGVDNSILLASRHPEVKSLVLLSGPVSEGGRRYLRSASWIPILGAASDNDGGAVDDMRWNLGFSRNRMNRFVEYRAAGHGTDMFAVEKGLQPMIVEWFEKTLPNAPLTPPAESASSKPTPVEEFWDLLNGPDGIARARQFYAEAKKRDRNVFLFSEAAVNAFGYQRLQQGDTQGAIEVFKFNVEVFPDSPNVYDSLGDAYVAAGNRQLAMQFSRKALEMLEKHPPVDPNFANGIRQSAEQKLRNGGAAPPPLDELLRMPVVYSVPGMDKVEVRNDVVYSSLGQGHSKTNLQMDVYIPAGAQAAQRFPIVVLISGGSVENPDWRKAAVYTSYGRLLAASGFVAVTFQKRYPPGPEGLVTGQIDTLEAIRYAREHAAEFHADPDRVAVWAFSAGGFMLAPALRDRPPYIRAVVNFYGVMDAFPNMPLETQRTIRENGLSLPQVIERPGPLPPIFIARAGFDGPALNAAIDNFAQKARARGASVEVMEHPNGRHGFDILDNDDRSREIIRSAIEFLKAQLQAGAAR